MTRETYPPPKQKKKLVFDVMKLHPSGATLKLANNAKQHPQLKDTATAAAAEITQKLKAKGVAVE